MTSVGVTESSPALDAILASPNPTSGWVELSGLGRLNEPVVVQVTDLLGREMRRDRDVAGGRLDFTDLPSGTFLIHVRSGGAARTLRAVRS